MSRAILARLRIWITAGALLMIGAAGCTRHSTDLTRASAAPARAPPGSECLPDRSGYLRLRARGAQNLDLDWGDPELQCEGGPRPDQGGLRLTFAARSPGGERRPRLVFGVAATPSPGTSRAVPANVTLILEGENRLYSTRGDEKCTIDELVQTTISAHSYRVAGRGFCAAPATSLDGKEDVLISRFDFAGPVVDAESSDHPK